MKKTGWEPLFSNLDACDSSILMPHHHHRRNLQIAYRVQKSFHFFLRKQKILKCLFQGSHSITSCSSRKQNHGGEIIKDCTLLQREKLIQFFIRFFFYKSTNRFTCHGLYKFKYSFHIRKSIPKMLLFTQFISQATRLLYHRYKNLKLSIDCLRLLGSSFTYYH